MRKAYRILILCLLAGCICVILMLSGQDGEEAFDTTYEISLPVANVVYEEPSNDQVEDVMLVVRNLGRVVAFTVFGMLLGLNVYELGRCNWKVKAIIIAVVTVSFSIFDEVHKLKIAGRHCTVAEIIINILCSMAAAYLASYLSGKVQRRRVQVANTREI